MTIAARPRLRMSHATFCLLYPTLLYGVCNAINAGRLARWFRLKDGPDPAGLAAFLVAGLALWIAFFTLFAHRRTVKPVAILVTVMAAAVTYFISTYEVAIDSSMILNAFHTDATEVGQLLSTRMLPYALGLIVVPVLAILYVQVTFAPAGTYLLHSLRIVVIGVAVAVGSLYAQYDSVLRAGNVSNKYIVYWLVPVNAISATINATTRFVSPFFLPDPAKAAVTGQVVAPGDLVVVLAIGESSRRQSFGVYGYARNDTTPELGRTPGLRLLNGLASRGTTLYALPRILEKDGVKLPLMVSRLGIPAACYVNYTLYDNCAGVGETPVADCGHGGRCYDEDVVPLLRADLRTYASGYRLVVLHLGGGSHGPIYSDRYPQEFQRFQPMCTDADVANRCTREQLYNAYDNTILYVDHVLGRIVETLDASRAPYVFIYLSDHGESLLEEGRMFHGMPPGIPLPPEQAQIPLIVKSSVPIDVVPRAAYRQEEVYDTVLELFSIRTPMFDTSGAFLRRLAATTASSATSASSSDTAAPSTGSPGTSPPSAIASR
jgi:lipid A ethanolaminephosphotransferase